MDWSLERGCCSVTRATGEAETGATTASTSIGTQGLVRECTDSQEGIIASVGGDKTLKHGWNGRKSVIIGLLLLEASGVGRGSASCKRYNVLTKIMKFSIGT